MLVPATSNLRWRTRFTISNSILVTLTIRAVTSHEKKHGTNLGFPRNPPCKQRVEPLGCSYLHIVYWSLCVEPCLEQLRVYAPPLSQKNHGKIRIDHDPCEDSLEPELTTRYLLGAHSERLQMKYERKRVIRRWCYVLGYIATLTCV